MTSTSNLIPETISSPQSLLTFALVNAETDKIVEGFEYPTPNPSPNSSITVEAESMQLGGEYKVETIGAASGNKVISLRGGMIEGKGAAKFNFNGASGNYNVKIHYFDENDGVGKFNLKQGTQQIASVNLNKQLGSSLANGQTLTTTEVKNVSIKAGDNFTLEGFEDGTANTAEHVRVDKIEFIPTSPKNPDPLPKPIEGSGWYKAFEDNFDDNKFDTSTWYNRTDKAYKTSAIEESNGKLKLHNEYSKNGESTGAWIQSREEFKFGYYEAEVHFERENNGKIWPTWWVWGGNANGKSTTEFDLFEYSGFAAKYFDNRPTTSHHYKEKKKLFPENESATVSDKSTNFREGTQPHKWGMLWTPWEVSFFYDGEKYMTSKHPEDAADPQEKLRLIFSTSPHLLVGPENEPANPMGNPTPGEALPSFIVDNVQVWQKDSYFDLIGNAIRINAGGDEFTDNSGKTWEQDKYFKNGQTYSTTAGISQTNDDNLFQSERYQNNLNYSIPLEKGNYTVNLTFAENYFDAAGERVFDVSAEEALKLDNLDIYNEAGGKNMILEKSFQVGVQDGFLNLDFSASVDNAKISAIEILPIRDDNLTGGIAGGKIVEGEIVGDKFTFDTDTVFDSSGSKADRTLDFTVDSDRLILSKDTFTALDSMSNGKLLNTDFEVVTNDALARGSNAEIVYNSSNGNLYYNENNSAAGFGSGGLFASLVGSLNNLSIENFQIE
ncbi:hypothetical protein H1P_2040003 [Hyella patelloides LEGE 07179]|uniref:GH16 domain-containing protein n=1 Tax=Hyella patelloides LEGE 07179 TaxID=945734 RepID=A0A563VQB0_9CYAN|nr:malectin domain-containing carbohydrate-binding protein [Hyella patelloides]VEP13569.1 hypothetical protein H1P_2040003 [Hyella patelloides LEGE 07179]